MIKDKKLVNPNNGWTKSLFKESVVIIKMQSDASFSSN